MPTRLSLLTVAAAIVALAACGSDDTTTPTPPSKIVSFTATLTPAGELGATLAGNPTGSGTFTATLDTSTNLFTYTATYSGLTSTINNGHIHGPFVLGGTSNTAAALLNFNPAATVGAVPGSSFGGFNTGTSGTASGSLVLNAAVTYTTTINGDSLRKMMLNGNAYVNIHTTTNAGGEIRGQLIRKP